MAKEIIVRDQTEIQQPTYSLERINSTKESSIISRRRRKEKPRNFKFFTSSEAPDKKIKFEIYDDDELDLGLSLIQDQILDNDTGKDDDCQTDQEIMSDANHNCDKDCREVIDAKKNNSISQLTNNYNIYHRVTNPECYDCNGKLKKVKLV